MVHRGSAVLALLFSFLIKPSLQLSCRKGGNLPQGLGGIEINLPQGLGGAGTNGHIIPWVPIKPQRCSVKQNRCIQSPVWIIELDKPVFKGYNYRCTDHLECQLNLLNNADVGCEQFGKVAHHKYFGENGEANFINAMLDDYLLSNEYIVQTLKMVHVELKKAFPLESNEQVCCCTGNYCNNKPRTPNTAEYSSTPSKMSELLTTALTTIAKIMTMTTKLPVMKVTTNSLAIATETAKTFTPVPKTVKATTKSPEVAATTDSYEIGEITRTKSHELIGTTGKTTTVPMTTMQTKATTKSPATLGSTKITPAAKWPTTTKRAVTTTKSAGSIAQPRNLFNAGLLMLTFYLRILYIQK